MSDLIAFAVSAFVLIVLFGSIFGAITLAANGTNYRPAAYSVAALGLLPAALGALFIDGHDANIDGFWQMEMVGLVFTFLLVPGYVVTMSISLRHAPNIRRIGLVFSSAAAGIAAWLLGMDYIVFDHPFAHGVHYYYLGALVVASLSTLTMLVLQALDLHTQARRSETSYYARW